MNTGATLLPEVVIRWTHNQSPKATPASAFLTLPAGRRLPNPMFLRRHRHIKAHCHAWSDNIPFFIPLPQEQLSVMDNPDHRPAVRHELYFFPDGDTIIRVEDSVFRIHRFFLTRESNYFWSMFLTTVPCYVPPGSSESNPVVLIGATSEAFADLLWVFYNREYSIYSATFEKWKRILALARKLGFFRVERLCVQELQKLVIPPVEKIQFYQSFNLNPDLLRSSYVALTIRAEPLELEEGKKLGDSTSLKITRARELARGPGHGATSSATVQLKVQLQESEIRLVVRDIFRLHGSAPTPVTN
ncbi:hypothetical protein EDB86DRAFT_711451 [Lactarius hatsudake]|nr:hypothetical protein EDB86DRAFT_711451 [Lactarius hatsudake]